MLLFAAGGEMKLDELHFLTLCNLTISYILCGFLFRLRQQQWKEELAVETLPQRRALLFLITVSQCVDCG